MAGHRHPGLAATGAPLIWFLIRVMAKFLTVAVGLTVMTSLVMISFANIVASYRPFCAINIAKSATRQL